MFTSRRLLKLIPFLVLLAAALPNVALTPPTAEGQAANPVATLEPVQGMVQIRRADAGENDWQTLTQTDLVSQGDWIRTDNVGLATLTFFEGVQSEVLQDSLLRVEEFQATPAPDGTNANFQVTIELGVGAMHHQINQVLDPQSRFEMFTPSAFITVRGTDFWTASTWEGESWIKTLDGFVQTNLILPGGQIGDASLIPAGDALNTFPDGTQSEVGPITSLPQYPQPAPLAPASCGNGICEAGETGVCNTDCLVLTSCGDAVCQADLGEGPTTCAQDCVPSFFRWGDTTPTTGQTNPVPQTPCEITTPNGNVEMRVGPGFNRGVRDYLPANHTYTVIGKATANDGSLWWQISVMGVPEAWVLQTAVVPAGACDQVPDVNAPPIIIAPPPATYTPVPGQPTATPSPQSISFYADKYVVDYGECATIGWDVEGIKQVYYENQGVTGHETRQECPYQSTTYHLDVITLDGQTLHYTVTIRVLG